MSSNVWTNRISIDQVLADRFGLNQGQELIRKCGALPIAKDSIDDGNRSIICIISTADVDRDGDVLIPSGLNESAFRRHPIVLFGHRYQDLPIGRNEWIKIEGKRVLAKTVYVPGEINAMAGKIFEFRQKGFPLAQSIGFMADEAVWADEDGFETELDSLVDKGWLAKADRHKVRRIIKKWTLYEYSDVVVPANPEALTLAVSKGLISKNEAEKLKDEPGGKHRTGLSAAKENQKPESEVLDYLVKRAAKLETENRDLKAKLEKMQREQTGLAAEKGLTLDGLEAVLPLIVRSYRVRMRASSQEITKALAKACGIVTMPSTL